MYGTKTYPGIQPIYSQHFLFRATASAIGGIVLGIVVSLIVNCTLLEISLNAFFATYFGLLFCAVGGIILWRVRQQQAEADANGGFGLGGSGSFGNSLGNGATYSQKPGQVEADARRRQHLQIFGSLILFSGFMCFMLEKDWYCFSSVF